MSSTSAIAAALCGLFLAFPAQAGPKGNASGQFCPPGLAKKDPPCVPPGQAGQTTITDLPLGFPLPFAPGDVLTGDYILLITPWIYRPDLNAVYVRFGDYLYLMDRDLGIVLDRIGPVADWTWGWVNTDFANCPPGLAKKDPPCVPPGLSRKGLTARPTSLPANPFDPYGLGDILPGGYDIVIDPLLFAPSEGAAFVRSGDTLYRIDSLTGRVLDVIGDLANLLR